MNSVGLAEGQRREAREEPRGSTEDGRPGPEEGPETRVGRGEGGREEAVLSAPPPRAPRGAPGGSSHTRHRFLMGSGVGDGGWGVAGGGSGLDRRAFKSPRDAAAERGVGPPPARPPRLSRGLLRVGEDITPRGPQRREGSSRSPGREGCARSRPQGGGRLNNSDPESVSAALTTAGCVRAPAGPVSAAAGGRGAGPGEAGSRDAR